MCFFLTFLPPLHTSLEWPFGANWVRTKHSCGYLAQVTNPDGLSTHQKEILSAFHSPPPPLGPMGGRDPWWFLSGKL